MFVHAVNMMLHELWNFDEFGSAGGAASVCALVAVEPMPESEETGPVAELSVPSLCELVELACDAGGRWSSRGSCVHHLYVTFMGLSVCTRRSTVPPESASAFGSVGPPLDFRMVSWARTVHSAVIFGGLAMLWRRPRFRFDGSNVVCAHYAVWPQLTHTRARYTLCMDDAQLCH